MVLEGKYFLLRAYFLQNLFQIYINFAGGCHGNGNQYVTESECLDACLMTATPSPAAEEVVASADDPLEAVQVDSNFLTLANGNGEKSFTFSSDYPFIQLKAADISQFKLRQVREIVFEFRSAEAQGLLVYHTVNSNTPKNTFCTF